MIKILYRCFFYPLAFGLLQLLRPLLNAKTREMIEDKNSNFFEVKNSNEDFIAAQRPFWIHAASGEIEYARPVIRELKERFPEVPVIVTFSSPSAKKILRVIPDIDAWGRLPWDFKEDCQRFLDKWQPRCCLIARTDVWPVMAETCHDNDVPSLLFSATFASNSSRLKGFSAKVTQWALNQLSEIHCVSEGDIQQLNRLNLQIPVHARGDTRFDQVFHRLQHPKPLKKELRPSFGPPVLVAGSTWPEDERVLIPAFKALKTPCQLILAPHEIQDSHLQELVRELERSGLSFIRYSTARSWGEEKVLLIDQVGILAELYTWGQVAFVGGSFRKQVHSVMEPLAAGLPVLVGPLHHNNREALVFKNQVIASQKVVTEVHDEISMTVELEKLLQTPWSFFSESLKQKLYLHMHSSQSVVDWCEKQSQHLF